MRKIMLAVTVEVPDETDDRAAALTVAQAVRAKFGGRVHAYHAHGVVVVAPEPIAPEPFDWSVTP